MNSTVRIFLVLVFFLGVLQPFECFANCEPGEKLPVACAESESSVSAEHSDADDHHESSAEHVICHSGLCSHSLLQAEFLDFVKFEFAFDILILDSSFYQNPSTRNLKRPPIA